MDGSRFDQIAREVAKSRSRRSLIKAMGAAAMAAIAGRGATEAAGQVTQATCGNVVCRHDPGICHDGCVCCVYANGNSRCLPPGKCTGEPTCPDGLHYIESIQQCGSCTTAADCPAATEPCTVAVCLGGVCGVQPAGDGTLCDDGNACTQSDTCESGVCVGGSPVVCTAIDQCHDAGVCDPATGQCSNPAKQDNSPCNDGNACTQTDTCQAGVCVGGNPVVCTAQDQCHLAGTCNPTTGVCSNPAKNDGSPCNDGNACTQTDTCQAGSCVGSNPVVCTALDECHDAGSCDPTTGTCSNPPKVDGSPCTGGSCVNGSCCTADGENGASCSEDSDCCSGNCFNFVCADFVTTCSGTNCGYPANGCAGTTCCGDPAFFTCGDFCCGPPATQCCDNTYCC